MGKVITQFVAETNGYDKKIKDAQRSLDQFGLKGTEVGQKMSGLGRVLTTNIGALSKWSVGLGAASAALKVAGDAFKRNEVLMDEWGRVTEGARSAYDSFLTALNHGTIDSYINNIGEIVRAAREAYDALDELSTFQAFNQVNQARNKAGYAAALDAFRIDPSETNREALRKANEAVMKDLEDEAEYAQKAYEATLNKLARENGMNTEAQQNAFAELFSGKSYGDLLNAKAGYEHNVIGYDRYNGKQVTEVYDWGMTYNEKTGAWDTMSKEENAAYQLAKALNTLTDAEIKELQAKGALAFNLREAASNQDRAYNKMAGNVKAVTTPSTTTTKATKAETPWYEKANSFGMNTAPMTEIADLVNQQKMYQTMLSDLTNFDTSEEYQEVAAALADINEQIERWKLGQAFICDEIEDTAEAAKDAGTNHIKAADATGTAWTAAASSVSQLGSAIGQLGGEEFNIAGVIAQAIANVALGLGQALSTKNHETTSPWEWIAAAISGTATMVGTIASIKSATSGFANGGMVLPNGSPYQGDNIVARLNAGEGVLTQQGIANAAALADGSGFGNLHLEAVCKAEEFRVMLKNNDMRRGRRNTYR